MRWSITLHLRVGKETFLPRRGDWGKAHMGETLGTWALGWEPVHTAGDWASASHHLICSDSLWLEYVCL